MKNNVSIVIPTFNRADYLVECIDACLAQTVPCEIIVCDHGSTDNTPEVVQNYGNRIKYIRRELDSGVHFCWLDGILHASHDLIHINYDDDWIKPTFIEECSRLFNDEVGCVLSDVRVYFESEKEYGDTIFKLEKKTGVFPIKSLRNFNLRRLTSPGAAIFRKKVLLDNLFCGSIPFSRHEYHGVGPDLLFSLMTCATYSKYGFVNEPLAIFRAHEKSITVDASSNQDKTKRIKNAYRDARIYYYISKIVNLTGIYHIAKLFYLIKKNTIKLNK